MTKKQLTVTVFVGITTFVAGFLLRTVWDNSVTDSIQTGSRTEQSYQSGNNSSPSPEQFLSQKTEAASDNATQEENTVSADSIRVRINDGQVQWYDGTIWHTVASVGELIVQDKFYLALESFQAFSQELQREKVDNPPPSRVR